MHIQYILFQSSSPPDLDTKLQYNLIHTAAATETAKERNQDIIEFVPVEKKEEKQSYNNAFSNEISNEITPVAVTAPKPSYKKRPGLLGGPSKGFRGLSSLQAGYHASTAPENFFKARPVPRRNSATAQP